MRGVQPADGVFPSNDVGREDVVEAEGVEVFRPVSQSFMSCIVVKLANSSASSSISSSSRKREVTTRESRESMPTSLRIVSSVRSASRI